MLLLMLACVRACAGGCARRSGQAEQLDSAPLRQLIGRAKATVQQTRAGVDGSEGLATLGAEGAAILEQARTPQELLDAIQVRRFSLPVVSRWCGERPPRWLAIVKRTHAEPTHGQV